MASGPRPNVVTLTESVRPVTTETPRSLLPGVVGVRDEVRVAA